MNCSNSLFIVIHLIYSFNSFMKNSVIISLALLALSACSTKNSHPIIDESDMVWLSTGFHEPSTLGLEYIWSEDGIHWDSIDGHWLVPEVGEQKVMRDPSLICVHDTFRLVWTAGWKHDLGFGYSWSTDLRNWSPQEFIPVMHPVDSITAQVYGCGFDPKIAYNNAEGGRSSVRLDSIDGVPVQVWAPELFYDEDNDRTLIIWASCVPGAFADVLEEHGNNHRLYYTSTKDWHHFAPTQLFIDPGFSVIDGTIVDNHNSFPTGGGNHIDANEGLTTRYTAVIKDNTRPNRNIKIAFSDNLEGPWTQASDPFTPDFCEGPTVVRTADGWYNIYYDAYRLLCFGNMRTRDFITFEDFTEIVDVPTGHKHGTMIKVKRSIIEGLENSSTK